MAFDGIESESAPGTGLLIGEVAPWAGIATTAPAGWLFAAGQNVSRTTYAALFAALTKSATVTITIASPGVISWTAHGLGVDDPVVFRTTGALPTGLTAGTVYYVIAAGLTSNAFEVATSPGGTAINTTGSQSGVHTGWYAPYGDGDGSTTFGIPDLRERVIAGHGDMLGTSSNRLTNPSTTIGGINGDVLGGAGGEEAHILTATESATLSYNTTLTNGNGQRTNAQATSFYTNQGSGQATGPAAISAVTASANAGDGGHNNVQPTIVLNCLIYAGV